MLPLFIINSAETEDKKLQLGFIVVVDDQVQLRRRPFKYFRLIFAVIHQRAGEIGPISRKIDFNGETGMDCPVIE